MSFEVDQMLRPELGRDERLLWSAMPASGIRFRPSDALAVPFSVMWGGFAMFWEYSVVTKGAPLLFTLWGIPFVLIGLHLIVGRFFLDSYLRARTFYGLTDQRVIIVSGLFNREVKSLALTGLSDVSLSERPDGSGTITMGPPNPFQLMWLGPSWPGASKRLTPALEFIDDARKVYGLIRDAQRDASTRRAT